MVVMMRCAVCDREIERKRVAQKYCAECSKAVKQERERRRHKEKKIKMPESNREAFVRLNEEARAKGLTYGQMVAMKEIV